MDQRALAWGALGLYVAVTSVLAYRGWRKTKTLESFAVGARDISPAFVGLSLAAQLTSVATFVINPGLVFAYGLAGLMGYGVAAALGITVGIIFFTRAFRRVGERVTAMTVPQWMGARYGSRAMSVGFGLASLGLVAYAVLIVVALAHTLHVLLDLPAWTMALGVIAFVFTYVLLGGVNTHITTNAMQAVIMLAVALLLLGTGLPTLWQGEGLFARLAAEDASLVSVVNPHSLYFRTLFEVFGCNALIGLALVCQPHILSKSLYLRSDRDVTTYLAVAVVAGVVFSMLMWVGLFARLELPPTTRIDLVVPTYMATHFSYPLQVLITVGILCAGISTLEGILLALSTVLSIDLYLGVLGGTRLLRDRSKEERGRSALGVGRAAVVAIGVVTFLLSWQQIQNPTGGSVAIFAQYGVYGLITASIVPLAMGMFVPSAGRLASGSGAVVALGVYVLVGALGWTELSNNPAFLATCGIAAGFATFVVLHLATRRSRVALPEADPGRSQA